MKSFNFSKHFTLCFKETKTFPNNLRAILAIYKNGSQFYLSNTERILVTRIYSPIHAHMKTI